MTISIEAMIGITHRDLRLATRSRLLKRRQASGFRIAAQALEIGM
jgi:hypothetical protein